MAELSSSIALDSFSFDLKVSDPFKAVEERFGYAKKEFCRRIQPVLDASNAKTYRF